MKRLRPWILGLASGCFAAGLAAAWVGRDLLAAPRAATGQDDEYLQDLTGRFALTSSQQRSLRLVLQKERESEYAIISSTEWSQLPPPILAQLKQLRDRTNKRIRVVLDDRQRALFDQQSEWPRPGEPAKRD